MLKFETKKKKKKKKQKDLHFNNPQMLPPLGLETCPDYSRRYNCQQFQRSDMYLNQRADRLVGFELLRWHTTCLSTGNN
jgi:hypothetical protein